MHSNLRQPRPLARSQAHAQQRRLAPHIPQQGADFRSLMEGAGVNVCDPIMIEILAGFDAIAEAVDFFNTPAGRAAELPAGNGVANARSLAKMYAACIGEIDGVRLLNKDTLARAMQPRTKDLLPLPPLAHLPTPPGEGFGLGFALGSPVTQMLGRGSFGHDGAGGRLGFAHPERGVAAGYACSSMLWDQLHARSALVLGNSTAGSRGQPLRRNSGARLDAAPQ